MTQTQAPKDKRTVGQKIDDLERAMINAYQMMNNMAQDLQASKEATDLLGLKTQAIIETLESGSAVTNDAIVARLQVYRMERMAQDVKNLETRGILVRAEAAGERSFIVGRDLSKDGSGTVVNPRMQFVVAQLPEDETRAKFNGAKAGDILVFSEDKNRFEIQEIYTITRAEERPEAAPAIETESNDEAPTEASST